LIDFLGNKLLASELLPHFGEFQEGKCSEENIHSPWTSRGREGAEVNTMCKRSLTLLACAWTLWAQAAVAAEKSLMKITHVTVSLTMLYKGSSANLDGVSFTVHNLADRPVEWLKMRAVIRSSTGKLIQAETFEEDLTKKPLRPREARQITHNYFPDIKGYMIDGGRGSVDVSIK
jgi:hypothetical protein